MPVLSSRSMLALGTGVVALAVAAQLALQFLYTGGFTASPLAMRALAAVQVLLSAVLYVGAGLITGSFVVVALTTRSPETDRPPRG
ncbi:hypothetical protein GCM10009821_25710 [Aeromicrobium halocynthiae]|uniref:Uncharacterized protein n=1 Tax=Aeromicrobium halocynthiae TaxID=560557 RepID=A0ABP5HP31_9ACTN